MFWNEQYVLESFLTYNQELKIIAALNYLKTHHSELLYTKLPLPEKY